MIKNRSGNNFDWINFDYNIWTNFKRGRVVLNLTKRTNFNKKDKFTVSGD